jgi:hypothetical protein
VSKAKAAWCQTVEEGNKDLAKDQLPNIADTSYVKSARREHQLSRHKVVNIESKCMRQQNEEMGRGMGFAKEMSTGVVVETILRIKEQYVRCFWDAPGS